MKSSATRAIVNLSSTRARAAAPIAGARRRSVATISEGPGDRRGGGLPDLPAMLPGHQHAVGVRRRRDQNRDVAGERFERGDWRRLGLRRHQHDVRGRVQRSACHGPVRESARGPRAPSSPQPRGRGDRRRCDDTRPARTRRKPAGRAPDALRRASASITRSWFFCWAMRAAINATKSVGGEPVGGAGGRSRRGRRAEPVRVDTVRRSPPRARARSRARRPADVRCCASGR